MIIWRLIPLTPSTWSYQIISQHWCRTSGALQSETQTCFTCSHTTISHSWLSFCTCHSVTHKLLHRAQIPLNKRVHSPPFPVVHSTLASLAVPDFDARQIWFCLEYTAHLNACLVSEKREREQGVFFFFAILYKPSPDPQLATLQFSKHTHTFARWHKRTRGTCRQQAGPDVQQ